MVSAFGRLRSSLRMQTWVNGERVEEVGEEAKVQISLMENLDPGPRGM